LAKSGTPPPPAGGELNHEQLTYSVQRFRSRKGTEIHITPKRKKKKKKLIQTRTKNQSSKEAPEITQRISPCLCEEARGLDQSRPAATRKK
jgi:hypothetical protein